MILCRPWGECLLVFDLGRRLLPALIVIVALVITLHQPVAIDPMTGISTTGAHTYADDDGSDAKPLHATPCCSVPVFLPADISEQIIWAGLVGMTSGSPRAAANLPNPPSIPLRPPRIA